MQLSKIDLSNLIAISHDNEYLGLVIDRGDRLEVIEIPAPYAAYEGLQQLDKLVSSDFLSDAIDLNALPASRPALPGTGIAPIAMHSVQSSMARAIGYDRDRQLLQVEFLNGALYQYHDVEPETYEALRAADSTGQFYNRAIKGNYPCDRC